MKINSSGGPRGGPHRPTYTYIHKACICIHYLLYNASRIYKPIIYCSSCCSCASLLH